MLKLIVGIVVVPVLLILALPVSNILLNEARLWGFARQLSEVDGLFPHHFELLAEGSQVYQSGNGETCGFRATRVYHHYGNAETTAAIKTNFDNMSFAPARDRADNGLADSYVASSGRYLVVSIQDGVYSAWFDFRCW
ncbi:MAG: hypothetical protein AAF299_08980 [Pseudomonadota bacterium]